TTRRRWSGMLKRNASRTLRDTGAHARASGCYDGERLTNNVRLVGDADRNPSSSRTFMVDALRGLGSDLPRGGFEEGADAVEDLVRRRGRQDGLVGAGDVERHVEAHDLAASRPRDYGEHEHFRALPFVVVHVGIIRQGCQPIVTGLPVNY